MIGTFRMALALCVLATHLLPAGLVPIGSLGVFGFYTLSGYLIARVLLETYRQDILAYVANRALRLYPLYGAAATLGLGVALWGSPLKTAIQIPQDWDAIWRQISIFGLLTLDGQGYPVRLVPPAWSLNVELTYYILMIVLVRFVRLWLVISAILATCIVLFGTYELAYFSFYGPSLCFAAGAALYKSGLKVDRWHLPLAASAFAIALVAAVIWPRQSLLIYLASAATLYVIAAADFSSARWYGIDCWLGRLSYPMFLIHWHVASILYMPRSFALFMIAVPVTALLSWILIVLIEVPIESLRSRIRPMRLKNPVFLPCAEPVGRLTPTSRPMRRTRRQTL